MTPVEVATHLRIAVEAAARAAEHLRASAGRVRREVRSEGHDIKIVGDTEAEGAILSFLSAESPLPVLSEECGDRGGPVGPGVPRWFVDPIDGSLNFNRGLPFCCISIGLWEGDAPILGVVHDFNRGEVFAGAVGQGATLDGEPISVSRVASRAQAVLCTGFPVYSDFSREPLQGFLEQVRAYKKVRLLGSAALSLAYVAAGRVDAYMEDNIMPWDVAAGLALVAAAGGRVSAENLTNGLRVRADNGNL